MTDWAKFTAKTAQKKDEAIFLQQTTSRIQDVMLLDIDPTVYLDICFRTRTIQLVAEKEMTWHPPWRGKPGYVWTKVHSRT